MQNLRKLSSLTLSKTGPTVNVHALNISILCFAASLLNLSKKLHLPVNDSLLAFACMSVFVHVCLCVTTERF